jgi:hypothetical protein
MPGPPIGTAFELLGRAFGIATTSPDIAAHVARIFPSVARPLEDGGADEVWSLRRADGQWLIEPPALPVERFAQWDEALEAIEFLVTSRLLALHPDRAQLHAAGAVPRGRAVLAIGQSGAGKSSIALHWSLAGMPVLGDDVVLLDHEDRAVAFPRLFTVHRARLADAGATPDATLQWGPADDEVRYDPRTGGGWAEPAEIGVVAMLSRVAGAPLAVDSVPATEVLNLLVGSLHPTGLGPEPCFERLARIARRARGVRVGFGEARQAAEALAALA